MRYTFFIALFWWMALPVNAQVKMSDYTASWKKVNDLLGKKYLPESALKEVEKIYVQAKKEKNDAQQLKALVYMGKLMEENTEDAQIKYIQQLEKEIKTAKQPVRSLLHSMIGSAYWEYLQENRWNLYNRTQTAEKGKDIETWTAADLHAEITKNYLASLEDEKALQQAKLSTYEPIIIKGNKRTLRPSLYDLVAHAALDYFANNERDLQQHAASFEISDPAAFAPAPEFSKHHFKINDSGSLYAKALVLYQDLIRYHLSDKDPEALIDLDLGRLQFMHGHAVTEDKDKLYSQALSDIRTRYQTQPASAQAVFLKLSLEMSSAGNKNILPRIKKDCEEIVRQFPGSEGGLNCQRLLQELNRRELSLQMEKVNLPDQPFRALVQFKNISSLHYRIIPLTEETENFKTRNRNENYWDLLIAQKPIKEIAQPLPVLTDLRNHSAEIKMDALPAGQYILLASADKTFSLDKNPISVQYFHVSRVAYINRGNDYFVLDRETGKPLPQADVAVWTQTYDYTKRTYNAVKRATLKSNLDGYFKLPVIGKNYEPVRLDINWKGDRLFMEETEYRSYSEDRPEITDREEFEKRNRKLFLFTDRGIYRPGQTVYFKGIILTRDFITKKYRVIPGYTSRIELYDVNSETIDSVKVTASEYGTFSGSFRLP